MEIMTEAKGRDADTHAASDFQIGFVQTPGRVGLGSEAAGAVVTVAYLGDAG